MDTRSTTLLVIGGGPGGYEAAIRAAQLGIATTLVESDRLGKADRLQACVHRFGDFARKVA